MLRASGEIEHFLSEMETDIRKYILQKTHWIYAPFCEILYLSSIADPLIWIYRFGHAIQTLETEFQWTFDTTNLQISDNWQYDDTEDFHLIILVNEEDSDDWNNYKYLLREWIDFMTIPFDHTSSLYEYHRARFEYQYISQKLIELLSGVWYETERRYLKCIDED